MKGARGEVRNDGEKKGWKEGMRQWEDEGSEGRKGGRGKGVMGRWGDGAKRDERKSVDRTLFGIHPQKDAGQRTQGWGGDKGWGFCIAVLLRLY